MRLSHLLLALLALVILAADATAGPLQRLRARRSGGCSGGSCVPSYAPAPTHAAPTYGHAIPAFHPAALTLGGCAGGKCPVR